MTFSGQGHAPRDGPNSRWRHDDRVEHFGGGANAREDRDPHRRRPAYESRTHERGSHPNDHYDSRPRSRSRSRSPRRHTGSHASSSRESPFGGVAPRQWNSAPSATLIVRGLTPRVTDPMLHQAFESFRPTSVRVMFHKATGEHRGFGFANFDSVQTATAVMDAYASQPMIIDNQPVVLCYAETNRPSPHFPRQHNGDHGSSSYGTSAPRLDWICDQCASSNFGRRTECFKCQMPKSRFAMEVPPKGGPHQHSQPSAPHRGHDGWSDFGGSDHRRQYLDDSNRREQRDSEPDEPPSHVLAVRMIPLDVDEGELQVAFAQFEGVRDIRLIRDRATNQSRGFAFVEFEEVEFAQRVKNSDHPLIIRGESVLVGYARETLQPRTTSNRAAAGQERPVPMNPIAAAALEQAQWAMANNYGAMHQPAPAQEPAAATSVGLDDLDALLNNAAAAARPRIEEPKKPWPLPFETGGGMYNFASDCGLYYDTDSMFYYDPHSKLYYNSFLGQYYRCSNGTQGKDAIFEVFTPPPPPDDSKFTAGPSSLTSSVDQQPRPVTMSLTKQDNKKPVISFSLKVSNANSTGKIASAFATEHIAGSQAGAATGTNATLGSGVSVAAAASASVRKKSALNIAKWSQRQLETSNTLGDAAISKPTVQVQSTVVASIPVVVATPDPASTVDVPLEAPICLLCRRKFGSMEQLRKHETQSKLHAENLAKAKQDKQAVAAQIRERDEEEREEQQNRKRQRATTAENGSAAAVHTQPSTTTTAPESSAAPAALESGIGAKMLQMMGWRKGEGLGKHGTGITAPVDALGNAGSETTGLGAKTAPVINLAEVASYKERIQKMARARYDAADIHDTKNL